MGGAGGAGDGVSDTDGDSDDDDAPVLHADPRGGGKPATPMGAALKVVQVRVFA